MKLFSAGRKIRIIRRVLLFLLVALLASGIALGFWIHDEFSKLESDDPLVWKEDIAALKADDLNVSPGQAVLFVGSSSIRFWDALEEDMAPIPVIKKGFGGAKMRDIIHYAEDLILPYQPKAIVLFAGTNDISGRANDKSPEQLFQDFKELAQLLEQRLPNTPLYFLAMTPTTTRWEVWPEVDKANRLIQAYAEEKEQIRYIDTTYFFINEQGQPNEDLLWWDGVHLNTSGYRLWTLLIKEALQSDLYATG